MTTTTGLGRLALVVALLSIPATAKAQSAAPATGFAISARVAQGGIQELAASATGSPEFTIGYRGDRVSIGLGIGLTRLDVSERDEFMGDVSESETTATLFQVGPDVSVRVWESGDRRTLGLIALGATLGRLSATDRSSFTGQPDSESTASAGLIGVRAGIGGDHYISRTFAIGVEGGFHGTFVRDIEEEGAVAGQTTSLGASGAYGALRVTVVLGP